jgi:DNA polymerase III sliding clamp (beta) subunit (PCNA family)
MEFAVDRGQFLTEVAAAARVPDGRSTQPLLSHLLLRATGGGLLRITGSDLKRTVTTECPAAVKTFGDATAPAQKLLTYLKRIEQPTGNGIDHSRSSHPYWPQVDLSVHNLHYSARHPPFPSK